MRLTQVTVFLFIILLFFQNCTTGFESAGYVDYAYDEIGSEIDGSPNSNENSGGFTTPPKMGETISSAFNIQSPPAINFSDLTKNLYLEEGTNHINSGSITSNAAVCTQPTQEISDFYSGRLTRHEFHNIIEDVFGVTENYGGVRPLHKMSESIAGEVAIIFNSSIKPGDNKYKELYENNRQDRLANFTDKKSKLAKIISNYPEQNEENYYKEMNRLNIEFDFVSKMLNIGHEIGELIANGLGGRDNKTYPGYIKDLGCSGQAKTVDCLNTLIHKVIPLLWRKQLTAEEIQIFTALAQGKTSEEDVKQSFIKIIQLAVASPQFYIKRSLSSNHNTSKKSTAVQLNNIEQATRLSFFLMSSVPDPILLNEALTLGTNFKIGNHIDRLLANEKYQKRFVRTFFGSILNIGKTLQDTSVFNTTFYDGGQIQYRTHYYAHRILNDLSNYFDKPLSSLVTDKKIIGNHALWINSFNTAEESSIIRRGIYVYERLLCGEKPEPTGLLDVIAEFFNKSKEQKKTNRQVLEDHLSASSSCATCHIKFDPLGLPYEKFNAFGDYREFYHKEVGNEEKRIRTDTDLGLNSQIKVNNDSELERNIAASIDLKACMTNHLTNKFSRLKSKEPMPCSIGYTLNSKENPTLKDMIKNTINSPLFKVVLPVEDY